jgi:hypothetical protein
MQVDVKNMSQGKNKGFISYNKNYGTSSLKKHVFNEHPKVGIIFVAKNFGNYQ